MAACQDNDKVHVNGVRGLGNLMAIHHLPLALANGHTTDSRCQWWGQAWLPQGIISLQTSLASSTEKVTFMLCSTFACTASCLTMFLSDGTCR